MYNLYQNLRGQGLAVKLEVWCDVPGVLEEAPLELEAPSLELKPVPLELKPVPLELKPLPLELEAPPMELKPAPLELEPTPLELKPAPPELKAVHWEVDIGITDLNIAPGVRLPTLRAGCPPLELDNNFLEPDIAPQVPASLSCMTRPRTVQSNPESGLAQQELGITSLTLNPTPLTTSYKCTDCVMIVLVVKLTPYFLHCRPIRGGGP